MEDHGFSVNIEVMESNNYDFLSDIHAVYGGDLD